MSTVTMLDGITIENVIEVNDASTEEALAKAKKMVQSGLVAQAVYVDHHEGLVLVTLSGNYRFQTPLCGRDDIGYRASCEILRLFGFTPRQVEGEGRQMYFEK